jgi:hypothetical protein
MQTLTLVIPIKNPPAIQQFLEENTNVLNEYPLIVIDSGGGELLTSHPNAHYVQRNIPMWEARQLGYSLVQTPFTLNLDCDVVVPESYIPEGLELLNTKADAVSIFYEEITHGTLEYGVSMWKTDILRKLYDFSYGVISDGKIVKVGSQAYSTLKNGWCECIYMWRKLKACGGRLETLPYYRAKHLKGRGFL